MLENIIGYSSLYNILGQEDTSKIRLDDMLVSIYETYTTIKHNKISITLADDYIRISKNGKLIIHMNSFDVYEYHIITCGKLTIKNFTILIPSQINKITICSKNYLFRHASIKSIDHREMFLVRNAQLTYIRKNLLEVNKVDDIYTIKLLHNNYSVYVRISSDKLQCLLLVQYDITMRVLREHNTYYSLSFFGKDGNELIETNYLFVRGKLVKKWWSVIGQIAQDIKQAYQDNNLYTMLPDICTYLL
jgi:hypothetical protein